MGKEPCFVKKVRVFLSRKCGWFLGKSEAVCSVRFGLQNKVNKAFMMGKGGLFVSVKVGLLFGKTWAGFESKTRQFYKVKVSCIS